MDRLQAMSTLVAVVDGGSFASAARALGLSPPVVTRAVADLEQHLGLRLLIRTTRLVRVTEAGARYVDDCRRILAEIDEAESAALGTHSTARGTLTLTAPVLFGQLHVMPVLARYLQDHPAVDAQCLFLDRIVHMVEEGVDVAVRIGELPDSSLQAVRVGQVRRVLVASPAYLAAQGTPATPQALEAHAVIAANHLAPALEWRFHAQGKPVTARPTARVRTTTNDAAIAAAVAGLGITRVLSYQVTPQLESGALQVLLADAEPAPLPVHVVHFEGQRATRKVRAFVDLAVEMLRANPALR